MSEDVNRHPDSPYATPTGLETPITDYDPRALGFMTAKQIQLLPVHLGAGRRYRLETWMTMCGSCLVGKQCSLCNPLHEALEKEETTR